MAWKQEAQRGHTIHERPGSDEVHDSLSVGVDHGGGWRGAGPVRSQESG